MKNAMMAIIIAAGGGGFLTWHRVSNKPSTAEPNVLNEITATGGNCITSYILQTNQNQTDGTIFTVTLQVQSAATDYAGMIQTFSSASCAKEQTAILQSISKRLGKAGSGKVSVAYRNKVGILITLPE